MKGLFIFLTLLSLFSMGAAKPKKPHLSSIYIVDRNGFSETINLKERLEQFEKVNFLQSQPYQKVMRTYERDAKGNVYSFLTSYYPNGQIKQYLEILNSRAYGLYKEWYSNGQRKLVATVIGGQADFEEANQVSWMFDGTSLAFNEQGNLEAKIQYSKGVLEGKSEHYYLNEVLKLSICYRSGVPDGEFLQNYPDGKVQRRASFFNGMPQGLAESFWPDNSLASSEIFENGRLMEGIYHPKSADLSLGVTKGSGKRMTLEDGRLHEVIEIRQGLPLGKVWLYNKQEVLESIYHTLAGKKEGEEVLFYPNGVKKLMIDWHEDMIHGFVRSYYPNGRQMSQKEISQNKQQGLATAWYANGDIMLIEEYENDLLQKGRYFKKGESTPISTVENGQGIATLYDPEGTFGAKTTYENGLPILGK